MEATMKNLVDALEDAARTYAEEQRALEEAQDTVLTAREDLETVLEEYEADGATPEEIEETLAKYGLSYDEISDLGVNPSPPESKERRPDTRKLAVPRDARPTMTGQGLIVRSARRSERIALAYSQAAATRALAWVKGHEFQPIDET
jgi:hypothetical protein